MLDKNDEKEAVKLRKQAQSVDTEVKQPAGHAIGFFEQGLMLGASVALTTIVSSAVVVVQIWHTGDSASHWALMQWHRALNADC